MRAVLPASGFSIRNLPPNIFAIVMATGIVSLAADGAGLPMVARVLFWLNAALYPLLWVLLAIRCIRHPRRAAADLCDHGRAPGFLSVGAATGVFGGQCVQLHGAIGVGFGLWVGGLVLWFGLTYTVLPLLMEGKIKPTLEHGINGGWLLTVVSTQAICILGCLISGAAGADAAPLLFAALAFWLLGGMLYGWLIALIFYRCVFLPLPARELTPAYWINMGAMAISTLAGVSLVDAAGRLVLLTELLPFLRGVTLLFWATATWWIPMLLALDAWRHIRKRFPLQYGHDYWEIVFPIGMYTVCTLELGRVFRLPFLAPIPAVFVWIALAVWGAAFVGLLFHLAGEGAAVLRAVEGRTTPYNAPPANIPPKEHGPRDQPRPR